MRIKVWGSRGSVPVSGEISRELGGNTTCLEVRLDSGESILIDAGTGICAYDREAGKKTDTLLLTHCHLDHIQGLPFCSMMYGKKPFRIIGADQSADALERKLALLFNGVLMPVMWKSLAAPRVETASPGEALELFGARVTFCPTCHPGGCVAWKIEADGWKFAFTGDHEIPLGSDPIQAAANSRLMRFLEDCDVALVDGHFTEKDHAAHPGWGHSSPAEWRRELDLLDNWKGRLLFTHFNPACEKLYGIAEPGGDFVFDNGAFERDGAVMDEVGLDLRKIGERGEFRSLYEKTGF